MNRGGRAKFPALPPIRRLGGSLESVYGYPPRFWQFTSILVGLVAAGQSLEHG